MMTGVQEGDCMTQHLLKGQDVEYTSSVNILQYLHAWC
jgi:hypothetical protein